MLKIRLKGRLGNQLFIYAFARGLSEKYNMNVLIYDRKNEKDKTWHSHLDNYNLSHKIKFTSDKRKVMSMSLFSKFLFLYDRLKTKKMNPRQKNIFQKENLTFFEKHRLFLLNDGFVPLPSQIKNNTFFDGYFQSPKYFSNIRKQIIKELTPVKALNENENMFLNSILDSESVCVTIRLGDYLGNSTHQVCTKKFYEDAMRKMRELHPNCTFFIFSDEIEKAKKIFNFPFPVKYDSGKMEDFMSLYVMSKCKHFIISNSSFSWWAQYLSKNKDKTVIAPDRWYAKDVPCDIYENNWLLLKGK